MQKERFKPALLRDIVRARPGGIDAVGIIPLVDLGPLRQDTEMRISRGLIPPPYGWNREKTSYAYSYKQYREWARSIIVAAHSYYTDEEYPCDRGYGRFARFTWRNNYSYLSQQLTELMEYISERLKKPIQWRILSNYTSIPEKPLFRVSGLADVGKNSVLIHRSIGSYFIIAEALTDMDVEFDEAAVLKEPDYSLCEECSRCLDSCPTGAIIERGKLDINRCLQYMSENLLLMPESYRERWGNRLYGCTTCIDVCPHNSHLNPRIQKHRVGYVGQGMGLLDALTLRESDWPWIFGYNQIGIRTYASFIKNAITACGSLRFRKALDLLFHFTAHENDILRAYACWAVGRISGRTSKRVLELRYGEEESGLVKREIEAFL